MHAGIPWRSLGEIRENDDQLQVVLANTGATVFLPVCVLGVLTLALTGRFVLSLLLALTIPISLLTVTWSVSYREPFAEKRITFFGRQLSMRRFALTLGDSVSADPIKDSPLFLARPRWYKLALWSSIEQTSRVIMRSDDEEEMEKVAERLNNAISRALSTRAA